MITSRRMKAQQHDRRTPYGSRSLIRAVIAVSALVFMVAPAAAQRLAPGVDKKLTATDRWPIHITYYASPAGKESPAIILLHMRNSNRLVWKGGFARQLQKAGYGVVAVDLRKHGESKPAETDLRKGVVSRLVATDYARMIALDLEAVKDFLLEEHHKEMLNIRKTGIIAPGMSAPLALTFAQRDWLKRPYADSPAFRERTPRGQDIRAIVLLSPEKNLPRINATKALLTLREPEWKIAFMIGYGASSTKDRKGKIAEDMYKKLAAREDNKKQVYPPVAYKTKYRGTDMLNGRLGVERHILNFFKMHLQDLPDKWRDRHSRLEK